MATIKRWTAAAGLVFSIFAILGSAQSPPDLVLTGDVTGAQNKTYFEIPFVVPAGTHRISVDFHYTGAEQRATLDLGIADPDRFRGESGGNKSHFTISETDATPSYLPGAIPAGQWRLLIAVPNMRAQTVSHYRAEIRFNARDEDSSFAAQPLASGTRWYRGDLHMHTAHSDGRCPSQSGLMVPCPVFVSAQTAASRRLDFIAITDHNADSQYDAMRELQPYFDRVLLIPGREMTTFHGHFNIFGVTQFIDWRVTAGGLDLNSVLRDVASKGGIASVSHAASPGGEICMGCRWEPPTGPRHEPVLPPSRSSTAVPLCSPAQSSGMCNSARAIVWPPSVAATATTRPTRRGRRDRLAGPRPLLRRMNSPFPRFSTASAQDARSSTSLLRMTRW